MMRDILESLSSTDPKVLEQSLVFARQRAAMEAERGRSAENRATAMLGILSILAGFVVPFVQPIIAIKGDVRWPLVALFVGCLLLLVKGLFGAIKVLGVSLPPRLEIETVFDFQTLSAEKAMREEIAGTIWECTNAIPFNSKKLLWLDRCQRSGLIAIGLFIALGVFLLAADQQWVSPPRWAAAIPGTIVFILLIAADPIFESRGVWRLGARSRMEAVRSPLKGSSDGVVGDEANGLSAKAPDGKNSTV